MIVVPDASVILKWVLQRDKEPDSSMAFSLLEAYQAGTVQIRLPTLWRYEVGNILGLKIPDLSHDCMTLLLAYEFPEESLDLDYGLAVLSLMHEVKGVSFYDACYHALALRSHGLYVTADTRYVKEARRKSHVALLSEWQSPDSRPAPAP